MKAADDEEAATSSSSISSTISPMKSTLSSTTKKRKHDHNSVAALESSSNEPEKKSKKAKNTTVVVASKVSLKPRFEVDLIDNAVKEDSRVPPASLSPSTAKAQSPPPSTSKKRKRDSKVTAEIEVDVSAPEPPSKKALRKAKKAKTTESKSTTKASEGSGRKPATNHQNDLTELELSTTPKQSGHGIWIGNLPWITTKAHLRKWFTEKLSIEEAMITRIHMPVPAQKPIEALRQKIQPQNKGFAYIDFSTKNIITDAIALSDTLLAGRRVLIKDARSFEGRPEPLKEDNKATVQPGHPPSKRVFIGNLPFDATTQELQDQLTKCGEILDVFVATFEDTGKCKGYAWIQFATLEAAVAAVRGWTSIEAKEDDSEEEEDDNEPVEGKMPKKPKTRKWWVNKIRGRLLRMEFAEDKAIRYKKRFGKDGTASKKEKESLDSAPLTSNTPPLTEVNTNAAPPISSEKEKGKDSVNARSKQRHNADGTKEGPSPASRKAPSEHVKKKGTGTLFGNGKPAPEATIAKRTGAIVQAAGKKITFE